MDNKTCCLWVGPGWNLEMLNWFALDQIDEFICVDPLPKLPHYTPDQAGYANSATEEAFIAAICDSLGRQPIKREGDVLTFELSKGRSLIYHINTTSDELLEACPELYPRITHICSIGFSFHNTKRGETIFRDCPNLEHEIMEGVCGIPEHLVLIRYATPANDVQYRDCDCEPEGYYSDSDYDSD